MGFAYALPILRVRDDGQPMFFILSKVIGFFALPSDIAATLAALGVALLFTRFRRTGRAFAALGVVLLLVAGLTPLGNALMLPLEERFPPWDASRGAPIGIIVLGGAIGPELSAARNTPDLNESAERITATAALARQYPQARIVYSGGNARLVLTGGIESDYAIGLLESLGVARSRIVAERQSRNTIENAEFSRELIQPKPGERWLLVTSAFHMPRSIGLFRKAGFTVEAYPVDWRVGRDWADILAFTTIANDGLSRTDLGLREWMGLVAYRVTGKIDAVLPGPDGR